MRIVLNGEPKEFREGITLTELLAELGVRREYTAVAVNREVTPKGSYGVTVLRDGDRVEIVRPRAGGSA